MAHIKVCELFRSVQGEGVLSGVPSYFIRLYGCNLNCVWCDTKYSWIRQSRAEQGKDYFLMTEEEVANTLPLGDLAVPLVSITGGEPLLQNLDQLVLMAKKYSHRVLVETNGTIRPSYTLLENVDIWSVSPKLSNAGFVRDFGLEWLQDTKSFYIKLVITNPREDLVEAKTLCQKLGLRRGDVFVQPDGNRPDYSEALACLIEQNLHGGFGFRVGLQLQRVVWGHKRGT